MSQRRGSTAGQMLGRRRQWNWWLAVWLQRVFRTMGDQRYCVECTLLNALSGRCSLWDRLLADVRLAEPDHVRANVQSHLFAHLSYSWHSVCYQSCLPLPTPRYIKLFCRLNRIQRALLCIAQPATLSSWWLDDVTWRTVSIRVIHQFSISYANGGYLTWPHHAFLGKYGSPISQGGMGSSSACQLSCS